MSDNTKLPRDCEAIQEDLTEFALCILTGERRSVVLDHVESCQRCSMELQQLSMAADAVLHLAPEVEPTLGFEQRLAERLQGGIAVLRPRNRRRISMLCAAAALTVVLGFGLGATVMSNGGDSQSPSTAANLTSAPLTSHGHELGEVYISEGKQPWMFMTVDSGKWWGAVTCKLIMANGNVQTVGTFKVEDGDGSWGALVKPGSPVRTAQLIAGDGTVMASANLSV